ncbi:lariat debranching enzyme, partial [Mortierella sp. NVP85]
MTRLHSKAIRNEADLETISCPRKYLQLGTFHKYYSGERKVPVPTVFIGGNHESSNYLWELTGHFEVTPYNDNHKRSVYHVRNYDIYKMLQVKEAMDVFLSHDWPLGIEQYGDTRALLRAKKHFTREVNENKLGSPAYEEVLQALRPAHWFSAHLHVRFTALVRWDQHASHQQQSHLVRSTAQASAHQQPKPIAQPSTVVNPDEINIEMTDSEGEGGEKAKQVSTAGAVKNPDEIEIDLDDDADQGQGSKAAPTQATVATTLSNPDEIQIEMDDENEEKGDGLSQGSQKQTSQQQQQQQQQQHLSSENTTPIRPHPTATKFLALDKCLPNRHFLEIIDLPGVQGPVEFKYDEEWLSIVRTLDSFLSLEYKQHRPIQGERLRHALAVNREWVRDNITMKRGLAIPHNFQQTAPAHDPVRTMGPQEKHEANEIDGMEGEEEYLEQQFEWVKEDQDPDHKDPKIKAREEGPVVIPAGVGWGGALGYHTSTSRLKIKDDVETTEPNSIETFNSVSLLAGSCTRSARSIEPYQERGPGEGADLAMNAEQFIYTSELLSTAGMSSCASLDPDHKSLEESEHPLWFIDTTPNGAPPEEMEVPYIDRPVEYDYSNRKKKRANRSKRGGVREREKRRRQTKVMAEDGHMLLEDTNDENDDAELALDDYMKNTMDDSMDNHTESFVASALQGRPLEIGHSMEVDSLEPDDLDLSLVGPEYPETSNGTTGTVTSGVLKGFMSACYVGWATLGLQDQDGRMVVVAGRFGPLHATTNANRTGHKMDKIMAKQLKV